MTTVGVISDTHGLLRPQALEALNGCELILHAGDVGRPEILEELRTVAPTIAVRGNIDTDPWALALPLVRFVDVGGLTCYMLHDIAALDINPEAAGYAVVIAGHSHKPKAERRNGVLYLNPGSAGPRRFSLPISVARLTVAGGDVSYEMITLHV